MEVMNKEFLIRLLAVAAIAAIVIGVAFEHNMIRVIRRNGSGETDSPSLLWELTNTWNADSHRGPLIPWLCQILLSLVVLGSLVGAVLALFRPDSRSLPLFAFYLASVWLCTVALVTAITLRAVKPDNEIFRAAPGSGTYLVSASVAFLYFAGRLSRAVQIDIKDAQTRHGETQRH
jgi:hypothetical protein